MHSEGVTQIGIEKATPLRQPQWHAAVDADEYNLPWSMVEQWRWSMRDTYVLFLRTLSKIAYRRIKKRGKKSAPE